MKSSRNYMVVVFKVGERVTVRPQFYRKRTFNSWNGDMGRLRKLLFHEGKWKWCVLLDGGPTIVNIMPENLKHFFERSDQVTVVGLSSEHPDVWLNNQWGFVSRIIISPAGHRTWEVHMEHCRCYREFP